MTVTISSFRGNFPEFTSTANFSDPEITFWLGLGANLLDLARWGNIFDYGLQLFVAHNLILQAQSVKAASVGQMPGQVNGPVTSGSVDKVSYARNPGLVMDVKNGHWNLSTYGLRYIQLVKMIGAGPMQVGVDPATDNSPWTGPWFGNMPNPSN